MMFRRILFVGAAMLFAVAMTRPVYAGATQVQGNLITPPITLDAGSDKLPAPAGDGFNDTVNVPADSSCPLPGIGACAADPNITCGIAPGTVADPFSGECPPSGGACSAPASIETCCVEALTGPDGITAGDQPGTIALGSSKGKVKIQVKGAGDKNSGLKTVIQCQVKDVQDGGTPVTTDQNAGDTGTCQGGPNDGVACTKNADCKDHSDPKGLYLCASGDEYNCTVDGIVGSNADNLPACAAPCLAVLAPAAGCGTAQGGLCAISTCTGGSIRDGQPCDITGQTSCPGGFCDSVGAPIALTGDETGFFAPAFSGDAYLTCPIAFELGYPIELKNGGGQVKVDLAQSPLNVCIPAGNSTQLVGAAIHAPSGDPSGNTSNLARIGFYTGTSTTSANGIPCPADTLPLPGSATGLPTLTGVGPIIGVAGGLAQ